MYACHQCGKSYTLRVNLRSHQRFECGKEKQFKCNYCSYAGSRKHHLETHLIRIHHMDLGK
nr:unnamed protein product [Callosobruchus analis]